MKLKVRSVYTLSAEDTSLKQRISSSCICTDSCSITSKTDIHWSKLYTCTRLIVSHISLSKCPYCLSKTCPKWVLNLQSSQARITDRPTSGKFLLVSGPACGWYLGVYWKGLVLWFSLFGVATVCFSTGGIFGSFYPGVSVGLDKQQAQKSLLSLFSAAIHSLIQALEGLIRHFLQGSGYYCGGDLHAWPLSSGLSFEIHT